jgi:hypothetical protein
VSDETRYPLCWPAGWKRTPPGSRRRALFGKTTRTAVNSNGVSYNYIQTSKQQLTVSQGVQRVIRELNAIAAAAPIVSTNVQLRLDGLPYSDRRAPEDPGAAVYWTHRGKKSAMAIDQYDRVADNLAAIAATLEALRAVERHGGAEILERTFLGFAQLPAPGRSGDWWREVLAPGDGPSPPTREGLTKDWIESRYKMLARLAHPDTGGSREKFEELVQARDAALREAE